MISGLLCGLDRFAQLKFQRLKLKIDQPTHTAVAVEPRTRMSPNVWDSLGEAYLGVGDLRNAEMCYRKAVALDPNHENAKKMLDKILNKRKN